MTRIESSHDRHDNLARAARNTWARKLESLATEETALRLGGGAKAIERQHAKGRLTARERIAALVDKGGEFLELGLHAAWGLYEEWGDVPAAGVICGIGTVKGRRFMIIANDATVKAGAFFPMTAKKVIRCQRIALENRLPLIYMVDSAGVFLPLQDEVFPDEDDFGRVFRHNAVLSGLGVVILSTDRGVMTAREAKRRNLGGEVLAYVW